MISGKCYTHPGRTATRCLNLNLIGRPLFSSLIYIISLHRKTISITFFQTGYGSKILLFHHNFFTIITNIFFKLDALDFCIRANFIKSWNKNILICQPAVSAKLYSICDNPSTKFKCNSELKNILEFLERYLLVWQRAWFECCSSLLQANAVSI